jgi:Asp-tRNA(Asn)/Glu-tRNA(Gln) amidotransferase A subunit family amidase
MLARPLSSRRASRLRVGVPPQMWNDLDPEVESACRAALESLTEAGCELREINLEGTDHALSATVIRLTVEGLPSVKPELVQEIEPQLSPVGRALTKYQLLLPAAALAKADRVRTQIRRSLADSFERVDVLAWPATPAPAPPIAEPSVDLPSGRYPADFANVRLGGLANLAGVPAVSVPCGLTDRRLPVGLQLLAPWREDERLFDIAELLEQATDRRYVDAEPPVAQTAAA